MAPVNASEGKQVFPPRPGRGTSRALGSPFGQRRDPITPQRETKFSLRDLAAAPRMRSAVLSDNAATRLHSEGNQVFPPRPGRGTSHALGSPFGQRRDPITPQRETKFSLRDLLSFG